MKHANLRPRSKPAATIQTKSRIDEPVDAHEKEADRISARVMQMPERPRESRARLQADHVRTGDNGQPAAPLVVNEVLAQPGHPLDASMRNFMEPRFGHDFSYVRVHADAEAARSADALNARAYTSGRHIVFARNEYSPQTSEGKSIAAHELAHVVQQGNVGGSSSARLSEAKLPPIMRKERDPAPTVEIGLPAESWFYADDPTGHVASIYFDTGSSEIGAHDTHFAGDNGVLDQLTLLLSTQPATEVMIEGYADTVGEAGTNQALSEARAREVAAWLFPLPVDNIKVSVTGHGARGPNVAAENVDQLSHYRRVDVIIKPPKETTPIEPQKGSGAQFASAKLENEMQHALAALDATLTALRYAEAGAPSDITRAALERYFPQTQYRDANFVSTLTEEIQHIRDRLDSIHYQEVQGTDVFVHCSTEEYRNVENDWDKELCRAIRAGQRSSLSDPVATYAFVYPEDAPFTIVLMPSWYRSPNATTILIHEASHLLLGLSGHPTEVPHRDPYAIGGIIAALGGLRSPEADRRYPAPTP